MAKIEFFPVQFQVLLFPTRAKKGKWNNKILLQQMCNTPTKSEIDSPNSSQMNQAFHLKCGHVQIESFVSRLQLLFQNQKSKHEYDYKDSTRTSNLKLYSKFRSPQ